MEETCRVAPWATYPVDWVHSASPLFPVSLSQPFALPRAVGVAVNRCPVYSLEKAWFNAAQKIVVGAYLHWYQKYGIEEDTIGESIAALRQTIENYLNV